MENKATELYVLLAVPLDVLEEAEIDLTGVIQFRVGCRAADRERSRK